MTEFACERDNVTVAWNLHLLISGQIDEKILILRSQLGKKFKMVLVFKFVYNRGKLVEFYLGVVQTMNKK